MGLKIRQIFNNDVCNAKANAPSVDAGIVRRVMMCVAQFYLVFNLKIATLKTCEISAHHCHAEAIFLEFVPNECPFLR